MLRASLNLTLEEFAGHATTVSTITATMEANDADMLEYIGRIGGLAKSIGGGQGLQAAVALGAAQLSVGTLPYVTATGTRNLLTNLSQMPKRSQEASRKIGLNPKKARERLTVDTFGTIFEIMCRIAAKPSERAGLLGKLAGMRSFDVFVRLFEALSKLRQGMATVTWKSCSVRCDEGERSTCARCRTKKKNCILIDDFDFVGHSP